MATVLNSPQRASGTGYEGQGPEIDLPEVGAAKPQGPLQITVHPNAEGEVEPPAATVESEQPVAAAGVAPPIAAGGDTWSLVNETLSKGLDGDSAANYMKGVTGKSYDDADYEIIDTLSKKIKEVRGQGVSDVLIKEKLNSKSYDPVVIDRAFEMSNKDMTWKEKYKYDPNSVREDVKDVADLYQNIYSKYSTGGKSITGGVGALSGKLFNYAFGEESAYEARKEIDELNRSISLKMNEDGFDTFISPSGDLMYRNENGEELEVESSILNNLYNAKFETMGSIGGGIAGGILGSGAGPVGTVAGATALSAGGAMVGRGIDMLINAHKLKEDLDKKLLATQIAEAGVFDGITSVAGAAVWKYMAVPAYKGVVRAIDFAAAGNQKGAYKVLLENLHLSEDQAKEIVENWKATLKKDPTTKRRIIGTERPMTKEEQTMAAVVSTQQGAESVVRQATANDPRLAQTIIRDIDARSKGLGKAIATYADENVGAVVRQDLENYSKDVKDFYGLVYNQGGDLIDGTDFRFDVDKIAITPVMESISKNITDPSIQTRFLNYSTKIDNLTKNRTFSGLLDFRQAVNDFKYSKTITNAKDMAAINTVINKIDGQIAKAVKEYMPEGGKTWTANFNKAKHEYAQMMQLQDNAIVKRMSNKNATEDELRKVLNKYGNKKDVDTEVFNKVVDRLATSTRVKVEAAAIKNLSDKFTKGSITDFQATDFPALFDAVKELNIKTKEGERLVEAIDQLAKVYRNDEVLSGMSGNISIPKTANSLATSAEGKARMFIISQVWEALKSVLPTEAGNNAALLRNTSRLLRNPMNVKQADEFVKSFPKDQHESMRSLVKELQVETAKQAAANQGKKKPDFIKMYKSGNLTPTNGRFGNGIYLVEKVANPSSVNKVSSYEVNMSRMATFKDISNLVASEVTEKNLHRYPKVQQQLIERGYLGIKSEGRVMLFPETTVGAKPKKFVPVEEREWPN